MRAHTGTPRLACMRLSCFEQMRPLSRPNAQMRWEDVWMMALTAKKIMVREVARKAVAAVSLRVACRQSS